MTTAVDHLLSLAAEASSEKRREVLRGVTEIFLAQPEHRRVGAGPEFDNLLSGLVAEMEVEVRIELATRLAPARGAPSSLMARLASDEIEVAAPVLARSAALSEADLITVVSTRGQEHLRVVSGRADLTERVADTIVERGDDVTLTVLLRNAEAPLSRRSAEAVVDRAQASPSLHGAVVSRHGLPPDLLNEMYFTVETRLREEITRRNAALDPAALDAALASSRTRLASRDGALPSDYAEAAVHIEALASRGPIPPGALAGFLRNGMRTRFLISLARAADLDFETARRISERRDLDALMIACRAAGYDRALFMTVAVLVGDQARGLGPVESYGRRYNDLTVETAQRTIRFWRMRVHVAERDAA